MKYYKKMYKKIEFQHFLDLRDERHCNRCTVPPDLSSISTPFRKGNCEPAKCGLWNGLEDLPEFNTRRRKLEDAVVIKQWITAAARDDIVKHGEWQCDWSIGMDRINNEKALLLPTNNPI